MPSAVIINAYSARNAGDAAIMLATAELMTSNGYDDVRILSRYADEDREFYAPYGIAISAPIFLFPVRGGQHALARTAMFGLSLLLVAILSAVHRVSPRISLQMASLARCHGFRAVASADAVVIAGGGYVYSSQKWLNLTLYHHLLSIKVSSWVSKRLVMMPQSIGPVMRRSDEVLVRWAYRGVRPLVVRDGPAMLAATSLMPAQTPVLCPDIAFYGWKPAAAPGQARESCQPHRELRWVESSASEPPVVCFVLMDWSWARAGGQEQLVRFEHEMAEVIRGCEERGYRVVCAGHSHLSEHGQDDVAFARSVLARAGVSSPVVDAANSPDALRAIYRQADVVVGTRMHSCILAMLELVPALALAYQPKATGLYAELGLSDWCGDVATVEAEPLLREIEQLLANWEASRARVCDAVLQARLAIIETYREAVSP